MYKMILCHVYRYVQGGAKVVVSTRNTEFILVVLVIRRCAVFRTNNRRRTLAHPVHTRETDRRRSRAAAASAGRREESNWGQPPGNCSSVMMLFKNKNYFANYENWTELARGYIIQCTSPYAEGLAVEPGSATSSPGVSSGPQLPHLWSERFGPGP